MKFSIALFVAGVAAATFDRRQTSPAATVQAQLQTVEAAINGLNTATLAFSGSDDLQEILDASNGVLSAISSAQSNIGSNVPDESIGIDLDGLALIQYVQQSLAPAANTAVDSAISKTQTFADACIVTIVLSQLNEFSTTSTSLIELTITKVVNDKETRDLAREQSQAVVDALNRGITAFTGVENSPSCDGGEPEPTGSAPPEESATSTLSTLLPPGETPTAPSTGPAPTVPSTGPAPTVPSTGPAPTAPSTVPAPTGGVPIPTGGSPTGPKPSGTQVKPTPPSFTGPIFTGAAVANVANLGAMAVAVAALAF